MISVCDTTAAAIKLCKAVKTFFLFINVAVTELLADSRVCYSIINILEKISGIADKLMTGIEISKA